MNISTVFVIGLVVCIVGPILGPSNGFLADANPLTTTDMFESAVHDKGSEEDMMSMKKRSCTTVAAAPVVARNRRADDDHPSGKDSIIGTVLRVLGDIEDDAGLHLGKRNCQKTTTAAATTATTDHMITV